MDSAVTKRVIDQLWDASIVPELVEYIIEACEESGSDGLQARKS